MKKKFTETAHCTSRVHCEVCRTDERFRDSLMQTHDWDGECPHGYTVDNLPEPELPSMPPVSRQVLNLREAVGRVLKAFVAGEQVVADKSTRDERIAICESCDQLSGARCAKCGCYTNKKIILQTEHCPIGKW